MWTILALALGWASAQAESTFAIELQLSNSPSVYIQAAGQHSIWLPQCRGVLWERFNPKADQYERLMLTPCESNALPDRVSSDGQAIKAPHGVGSGDRIRVTVVVGVECKPDRPIEIAQCQRFEQRVDRGTIP